MQRLIKHHQKEFLKLWRNTVLRQQFIDTVHRQLPQLALVLFRVTLASEFGKPEDDAEYGWSDGTGERDPAEEVDETSKGD